MAILVSLFRAINVGGHSKVSMAALKEIHESLGLKKVSTYLQTGNVVFESEDTDPTLLAGKISQEFEKKFGFRTEVMVRTSVELKEIFNRNPFLNDPEKETKQVVVMFLATCPDDQAKKNLLSAYAGPEKIAISDKELYIYYPNGMGRSKLSNVFIEKKLKTPGTARNWNTVTKLVEMAPP